MSDLVDVEAELFVLAQPYLWWEGAHDAARAVIQIMNWGTYRDILSLERLVPPAQLAEAMRNAAPGLLSPRSWEFWRGRLGVAGLAVPSEPLRRHFADAELL
jgi:hypothetical protein